MDCRTFAEVQQNAGAIANLTKEKEGGGEGRDGGRVLLEQELLSCFPVKGVTGQIVSITVSWMPGPWPWRQVCGEVKRTRWALGSFCLG